MNSIISISATDSDYTRRAAVTFPFNPAIGDSLAIPSQGVTLKIVGFTRGNPSHVMTTCTAGRECIDGIIRSVN